MSGRREWWARAGLVVGLVLVLVDRAALGAELGRAQLRAAIAAMEAEAMRAAVRARAAEPAPRPLWRPPPSIAVPMAACLLGAAVCFTLIAVYA